MFDINFFPLNLINHQEQPELAGLLVTIPPRRPERNRSEDLLMLLVSMAGSSTLSNSEFELLLEAMNDAYYSSRGTTTSAMQSCADELNNFLRQANAKRNSAEGQVLALLNMAVLRRNHLYYAHAGATHSFLINAEGIKHFSEVQGTTRTVGSGRSTSLVYSQSAIDPGSVFIMSPQPPSSWNADTLKNSNQISLENLRRRLLQHIPDELQAAVLQFQNGDGTLRRLRRRGTQNESQVPSAAAPRQSAPPVPVQDEPALPVTPVATQAPSRQPVSVQPTEQIPSAAEASSSDTVIRLSDKPSYKNENTAYTDDGQAPGHNADDRRSPDRAKKNKPETVSVHIDIEPLRSKLAEIWNACSDRLDRMDSGIRKAAVRVLPGLEEQPLSLSSGAMLFIAIAVPLIVVAAATTVYIRNGRYEQHYTYLEQAELYASNAQDQDDITLKRMAWEKSIEWIDTAENYTQTEDSIALREVANLALDELDGISTFPVQQALSSSFESSVEITTMASNNTEAYLLDKNAGSIYRLFLAGKAYEVDPAFDCGPGLTDSVYVNQLVDIVTLPLNNGYKASVMAIDEKGNLLYCRTAGTPSAKSLVPPDQPWGKISALALQSDSLYVLDIASNALWVYHGNDLTFEEEPFMFFGNDIPDMKSVVDFAINEDSLYLLHKDGKMTVCLYSPYDFSPTTCSDTTTFMDMRNGQNNQPISFVGSRFSSVQATYPLEPSIYTLETEQGFIYHLSLQLNLHHQYRPDPGTGYLAPSQPPTAFTITPGRILLLAYQNQIYFATLP